LHGLQSVALTTQPSGLSSMTLVLLNKPISLIHKFSVPQIYSFSFSLSTKHKLCYTMKTPQSKFNNPSRTIHPPIIHLLLMSQDIINNNEMCINLDNMILCVFKYKDIISFYDQLNSTASIGLLKCTISTNELSYLKNEIYKT